MDDPRVPSELPTNGKGIPGYFCTPVEWEAESGVRAYRHHLKRASETFNLTGVFFIEGKPTVYFTKIASQDANREAEWQRLLWNQDTASMLVVEDPTRTRIYSALAKPSNEPASAGDTRLADTLETAAFALEFRQFLLSVQTGQFYRDHAAHFRTETAVDQYLLANLTEARKKLTSPEHEDRLSPEMANAFLARCLFTTYLIERDVIGKAQLEKIEAPVASTLRKVLENRNDSDGIKLLFRLFRLLDDDFNGSMFGGSFYAEQTKIRARHISVLRRLLRGDDLRRDQQVLFDLYDFHFIPIELISAIYENFIVGRSQNEFDGPDSEQRQGGAYYTPPRLAELVVDIATEGWDTLLDKQCLDPACGSGVFLVILFQRMACEWCHHHPHATNVQRARELRRILTEKLCGVDLDPTACMVACFSLYLAFLDQLKPRDIWELKDALDAEGDEKVLPPLHCEPTAAQGRCPVILETNFFSQDADRVGLFDLVIGNPPWTGRKQSADPDAEAWLLGKEPQRNPHLKDAPRQKQARVALFFPQKQSAIAYMWKVPQHLKTNGVACLLLPSRVILANKTDAFQNAWFRRFTVDAIWQLADFSFILFNEADCPAIVAKFRSGAPDPERAEIRYYTPKIERVDPRHAAIVVTPDDCKPLHLADLLAAAKDDCAYMFWKMPFWGTDRDRRLLDRLRRLPRLGDHAGEPGEKKRWVKGQGFKPWYEKSYNANPKKYGEPKPRWWDDSALFLDARSKGWALILFRRDCTQIGPEPTQFHRLPDKRIFREPLVIVNQGCTRFAFADFDVLFEHALQSIGGKKGDEDLLLFLTAVLSSPLATYYLFHTSANWGIERDKVHFEELMQLPFPLPDETENATASRRIVRKAAARIRKARGEMAVDGHFSEIRWEASCGSAIHDLTELVYQYFSLCSWERSLVEDTVTIFEPSSTPPSIDSDIETLKRSDPDERKSYAELLCRTINRWARRANYFLVPSAVVAAKEGLVLLTLAKKEKSEPALAYREQVATRPMSNLIERVAAASVDEKTGGLRYLRGFALFEERDVHILKPISRHHWTRTAALNDSDELADFIANMGREA